VVVPDMALVEGSKKHDHHQRHHHHSRSRNPFKWIQRHSTIFESGPESQEEEVGSEVPDRLGDGLGVNDLK
jgi:hypothetical protein